MAIKRVKNIKELQAAFASITGYVASDTRFLAQAAMFAAEDRAKQVLVLAELISIIAELVRVIERRYTAEASKRKRPPTAYQRFFGQAMKDGMTAVQAAEDWKTRKAVPAD